MERATEDMKKCNKPGYSDWDWNIKCAIITSKMNGHLHWRYFFVSFSLKGMYLILI